MWAAIKSISSLLLSFGLLLMGNGMMGTLLGLRSRIEGFSTEITGFIMAGFFVGMLAGALLAVRVIAAVGHVRAFAAFASVMSIAVLAHLLVIDPLAWFLLRVAAGFCMSGMIMVVESWVNERATNETRGRILSVYMITNYLGAGLGQFMMLIDDPAEFKLFVIASMVYSLALVPILLSRASAPKPSSPERMGFKSLLLISPVGVVGVVCSGLANSSLNGMGAVFAREAGLSVAQVSLFMAVAILGGITLQFPLGRLSDRFDRRTVLIISALLTAGVAYIVIMASSHSPIYLITAIAFYGGLSFVIYPISSSQVNDLAPKDKLVQVASGLLIAYGIGASLGPIVSAQFMAHFGPRGFFYFLIGIYLFLTCFTLLRILLRSRNREGKAPFMPLGSVGVSSKQLYSAALSNSQPSPKTKSESS